MTRFAVRLAVLLAVLGSACPAFARQCLDGPQAPPDGARLTIWLMPAEPVEFVWAPVADRGRIDDEVATFDRHYGAGCLVTVLNTTVPRLRDQLLVSSADFGATTWAIVRAQKRTLAAIERFAQEQGTQVRVRFISWATAFEELRTAVLGDGPARSDVTGLMPDVAQIGSTWAAFFAEQRALASGVHLDAPELIWHDVPEARHATLRYTTDVRVLFYWKRLPPGLPEGTCTLEDSSWAALTDSLEQCRASIGHDAPPLAMPIGFSSNLLLDYAPLVWAGGADPFDLGSVRKRANLTSPQALAVPLLLAKRASREVDGADAERLIAFPESEHAEATQRFFEGRYRGLIEPFGFLRHWYRSFTGIHGWPEEGAEPPDFWEYVGIAVPPVTFLGGSDLAVLEGAVHRDQAFALASFLATDDGHTKMLAELGELPAHLGANAVETLLAGLGNESIAQTKWLEETLDTAFFVGRGLPSMAAWPVEIESRGVLESLQVLWRRLAEGDVDGRAEERVAAAAADLELAINLRIDPVTRLWAQGVRWWPVLTSVLAVVVVFALVLTSQRARALQARAEALENLHRVRSFASTALLSIGEIHSLSRTSIFHEDATPKELSRALILRRVLNAWTRALGDVDWERAPISEVVHRAVVQAMETPRLEGLFRDWVAAGEPEPAEYLKERGAAVPTFRIHCPKDVLLPTPFLCEQALVCLVQNAVSAARKAGKTSVVEIGYDDEEDAILITNPGEMGEVLLGLVNDSTGLDDFRDAAFEIQQTQDPSHWPGLGIPEAFQIASQCYAGLRFEVQNGSTRTLFYL